MMEVILLERVEKLGQMGEIVRVKPGFARNYLLPQNKALRATKANMTYFEAQRAVLEEENLKRRADAEAAAERLDGVTLTLIRSAGASGQLYGSVAPRDVAAALGEEGISIKRDQVMIDSPIKTLGLFEIRIRLHGEVSRAISVNIARSLDEAELQLQRGGMVTSEILEAEEAAAEAAAAEAEAQALIDSLDGDEDEGDAPEAAGEDSTKA